MGDTETLVMVAAWAWYVRKLCRLGTLNTWILPLCVPSTILSPATVKALVESPLRYTLVKLPVSLAYFSLGSSSSSSPSSSSAPASLSAVWAESPVLEMPTRFPTAPCSFAGRSADILRASSESLKERGKVG